MDFEKLTRIMRRLALEAGDRIMKVYNSPGFEVKAKSDTSPVTEADEAADALIVAGLRAAFPDVPLITEEQAATHGQTATTFLIVDPLDGTREFVQRRVRFMPRRWGGCSTPGPMDGLSRKPAALTRRCRDRCGCWPSPPPTTPRWWWWRQNRTAIRRRMTISRAMR